MKITIGTKNPSKVEAVRQAIQSYDFLKNSLLVPKKVDSEVSDLPKGFDEIISGAKNRAKSAFEDGLSFGLESGIVKVPHTKSGFIDFCCCVIYDGEKFHLGLSSGFEYPKKIIDSVIQDDVTITQAFFNQGLTNDPEIGKHQGAIGWLTKGIVTRKDYTIQSIQMAMIHLQNKDYY